MQVSSRLFTASAALVLGATTVPLLATPALAAPPPVITSFTPASAAADDTVTLTATNIDLVQANNTVKVNGVNATVTGKTLTTLTIKVPPDTSGGKIVLTTPGGTGTSATDIFIAPPFSTVAEMSSTARTTVGTKASLSIPAGKKAIQLFDATAGERFAVQTAGATPGGCSFEVGLWDARLVNLGTADCRRVNTGWLETTTVALVTGTQTLVVNNMSTSAGLVDVTVVKIPADANLGTLPLDGTTKAVDITSPGQNGYLSFTTTAINQKISVKATGASATYGCCGMRWGIYRADGTRLGSSTGNAYLDSVLLPSIGTYQLRFDPLDARTGSINVTASLIGADADLGTLALDGTTKTVNFSTPGQNAYLTIAGTTGQKVAIQTTNASTAFGCCGLKWGLYTPTGTRIGGSSGNAYLDKLTLPTTGNYQLRFDPADTKTGSVTVAGYVLQTDADLGALPLTGTPTTATVNTPGQNGYLTFTGTAGQKVALQATNTSATFGKKVTWGMYTASGTRLGSASGNAYLNPVTLPATGTYQVRIDPADTRTGSITLTGWVVPADIALGTLPTDGTPVTATISTPGQNGYLTFSGTSGQKVTLKASRASTAFGCCGVTWTIKRPDGSTQKRWSGNVTGKFTLTASGTHQVYVDPADVKIGSITFSATVTN
ncbi:IPT/TIG domain-containing protein [Actinoplanes sp. G11-F43]|uniref:IPT/TIG domain-containing protein n=1 Tax=Actinoplanes sp. G11-F43 TaxID=3424130 RepID=UPI003D347AE5